MAEIITRLAWILAPEATVSDPAALEQYRLDGRLPLLAVFPHDAQEAALVLKAASEDRLPIVPWGSGTWQVPGAHPEGEFIALCTARLNEVTDLDPENLTVTAGAGTILASLQELVRPSGLALPLDPPHARLATIGGILASAGSGPRRLQYGAPRDLTLGLRAALPSGEVIRTGGKTVKNVAGYDLTKLFVGSLGTLGLITEATLRLRPLPEEVRTLMLSFESLDGAAEVLARVMATSQIIPAALVLINPSASALVSPVAGIELRASLTVAVALEGFGEEVDAQASRLAAMAPVKELGKAERLWELLSDGLPCDARAKVGLPIGKAPSFVRSVDSAASAAGLECPMLAHAGVGIVYLFPQLSSNHASSLPDFLRRIRLLAEETGGYLVLEKGEAHIREAKSASKAGDTTLQIARRIKDIFDPQGIMNPARVPWGR